VTDTGLVLYKLGVLHEHVERIRRRRPASAELLRADVDRQDAIARFVGPRDAGPQGPRRSGES